MARVKEVGQTPAPLRWKSPTGFVLPAIVVTVVGAALSWPLHQPHIGRLVVAAVLGVWLLYAIAYALRNRKATNEALVSIVVVGCTFAAVPAYFVMSACGVSLMSRAGLLIAWLLVPTMLVGVYRAFKAARRPRPTGTLAARRR